MNILLTGITGFLGSHLAEELLTRGHQITGIVRKESKLDNITPILGQLKLSLSSEIETITSSFDAIIHVATDYGRDKSFSDLLDINLIWPLKILDKLSRSNAKIAFINTDTFFNKGSRSYAYLGNYTHSKHLLELALKTYINQVIINLKLEHIYGPRDGENKFVPTMIKKIVSDEKEIDLTDGNQKRDFTYVKDACTAYSTILDNLNQFKSGMNNLEVGNSTSHSIRDLMNIIMKSIPESKTTLNWGALPQRSGEFEQSKANIEKLRELGWNPQYTLEKGILETINYYK
ncbi:MAG: epimerase [Rickettsiales bacterium]|nr:epimerase [Rickettsiales bacterium]